MRARFVRLNVAGFKSFAEPVTLEILPGLTGIVGPNGCGKSNVAEALRWAMGEGSAKSLRGGEMDDVIFAGTTARPSRNLAEVVLTLEAEAGDGAGFPPPYVGPARGPGGAADRARGGQRLSGERARDAGARRADAVRRSGQRLALLGDGQPGTGERAGRGAAGGAPPGARGGRGDHRAARAPGGGGDQAARG